MTVTCKYKLPEETKDHLLPSIETNKLIDSFLKELKGQQKLINEYQYAIDKFQCFKKATTKIIDQKLYCHVRLKDIDWSIPIEQKSPIPELNLYRESIDDTYYHLNQCSQIFNQPSLLDEKIIGFILSFYDDKCLDK